VDRRAGSRKRKSSTTPTRTLLLRKLSTLIRLNGMTGFTNAGYLGERLGLAVGVPLRVGRDLEQQ